jgi:hypothetical protein
VPNNRSEPIVFHVEVAPASATGTSAKQIPPKRGQAAYEIRYRLPARDVQAKSMQGDEATMAVGTAVLAFDRDGEPAARQLQETTMTVNAEKARTIPHATITVSQRVNLPFGRNYLYLAVWDTTTGRLGTLTADVKVEKPGAGRP